MCAICSEKKKSGASYAPMAASPLPLRTEEAFAGRVPGYGDSDYMSPMQRPRDDINYDSREYDYNYSSEGSAKGGALGAIIGTVAGLVVYVATMLMNLPVSALATFAGIGGVLGYIAFGGPRKKSSAVKTVLGVSAGVSVLFVLINHVFSGVARAGSFSGAMAPMLNSFPWVLVLHLICALVGVVLGAMLMEGKLEKYIENA